MTARLTNSLAIRGAAGEPTPIVWSAESFAVRCAEIVETQRGHEAHRSLDILTNEVLASLGFGEGVRIFEAAVRNWHGGVEPYPYPEACPDCQAAALAAGAQSAETNEDLAQSEASQSGPKGNAQSPEQSS